MISRAELKVVRARETEGLVKICLRWKGESVAMLVS